MKRYIDAYALENRVEDFEILTGMKLDIVHDFVSSQSTADVRENVKGKWIKVKDDVSFHYECSVCRTRPLYEEFCHQPELSDFCPNCGADMRGEQCE